VVEGLLVRERAGAAQGGEMQRSVVGGWRFAEDEELYEDESEDCDGELADEEALCEGEAGAVSGGLRVGGRSYAEPWATGCCGGICGCSVMLKKAVLPTS
jgi:hypothetical protein